MAPCYFKKQMTDDVLLRYFSDVADAVSVPCLVYNAPQYAGGVGLSPKLIWNLLNGRPEQECIDFAAAYSALCHTIRNDWNLVTTEEAYDVMNGGSARVKR